MYREVENMGIHKMEDRDAFSAFIEYQFMCETYPTYAQQVKESKSHDLIYSHAVRKIEFQLQNARNSVHSEAWRQSERNLLTSLEYLAHVESNNDGRPDQSYQEWTSCDACGISG